MEHLKMKQFLNSHQMVILQLRIKCYPALSHSPTLIAIDEGLKLNLSKYDTININIQQN